MLATVLLARLADAGCAVDPDAQAKLEAAGLVATGTVVRLDVATSADDVVITSHVRLDPPLKGQVDSGWIALVTTVARSTCPGNDVYPPDARVYVIDTPNAAGEVNPSICTRTVGYLHDPQKLAAVAGVRPDTAGRYGGHPATSPPSGATPKPFPAPDGREAVVVHLGEARVTPNSPAPAPEGRAVSIPVQVAGDDATRVRVFSDDGALQVALWVDRQDLAVRPTRPVALSGGPVVLAPGAPITLHDGVAQYASTGIVAAGTLPADALGVTWKPAPPAPLTADRVLLAESPLRDAPEGRPVAALQPGGDFVLALRSEAGEFVEVQLRNDDLSASGWLPKALVGPADGGGRGYGTGGGSWSSGPRITLLPGVEVVSTDAAVTFGRAVAETEVELLARDGDLAWVLLRTPWGPFGGSVTCAKTEGACGPRP